MAPIAASMSAIQGTSSDPAFCAAYPTATATATLRSATGTVRLSLGRTAGHSTSLETTVSPAPLR